MCACAIGLTTANVLCQQNINARDWTYIEGRWRDTTRSQNTSALSDLARVRTLIQVDANMLIENHRGTAWDNIAQYYLMEPTQDRDMYSHSPVPLVSYLQWRDKLDLGTGVVHIKNEPVLTGPNITMGALIVPDTRDKKADIICTSDFLAYRPSVMLRDPGDMWAGMQHNIENWAQFSNVPFNDRKYNARWTSLIPTYAPVNIPYSVNEASRVLVRLSLTSQDGSNMQYRTSPIQYPDPPSGFLHGMREYLLWPALLAGLGYLTGGPIGAVGAGATGLVEAIRRNNPPTSTPPGALPSLSTLVSSAATGALQPLTELTPASNPTDQPGRTHTPPPPIQSPRLPQQVPTPLEPTPPAERTPTSDE